MNTRTCTHLTSLILLAFVMSAPAAYAAEATTTFNVTARIDPACTVSADNLNFGDYGGSGIDTQSNIKVNCNQGLGYELALSNGNNFDNVSNRRQLKHGTSDFLRYDLFTTSARTVRWNTVTQVTGTGTGSDQLVPVYGRLGNGQSGPAGNYSDTITVTLNLI